MPIDSHTVSYKVHSLSDSCSSFNISLCLIIYVLHIQHKYIELTTGVTDGLASDFRGLPPQRHTPNVMGSIPWDAPK